MMNNGRKKINVLIEALRFGGLDCLFCFVLFGFVYPKMAMKHLEKLCHHFTHYI